MIRTVDPDLAQEPLRPPVIKILPGGLRPHGLSVHLATSLTMLISLLLCPGQSSAGEFQSGQEAFKAGQFQSAGENWQRCAKAGNADCQYGLGVLYDEGLDRTQDSIQAQRWYQRAALGGSRDAQIQLGFIFAIGREGISQAPVQSFIWFSMAANNGSKKAELYRDKVAQRLSAQELEEAHSQLLELGIQYHLQE